MGVFEAGDGAGITAVIFDMDGVVTDTATAHFAAWKAVFDPLLEARGQPAFDAGDYREHVDGVPRLDGIRRLLDARGIALPEGGGDDAVGDTVHGLAARKNARFREWLERNRVPVFDDTLALIDALRAEGVAVGLFSASRNAGRVLESAGIADRFAAVVGGVEAADMDLAPKPRPDTLVETARRLGAEPAATAVVEDAVSGVQAAAAGHFAFVIGVARGSRPGGRHALRAQGADIVTTDLSRLIGADGALRTLDRLPSAWDGADALAARLTDAPVAAFLDYDGVLTPIVEDYRAAHLPPETREALRRLAACAPVAVISGRDLADVRGRVDVEALFYAGSHGFDIAGPGGLTERPSEAEAFLGALDAAEADLRARIAGIPGAEIERKTFSIAVHHRNVAETDTGRLEAAVEAAVAAHDGLGRSRGKKVFEIQPDADWDKGRAVRWLLEHTRLGEDGAVPLYIGDDLTDEDAFDALAGRGVTLALRGGGRPTLADHALEDPADVRRFLLWLAERAEARA